MPKSRAGKKVPGLGKQLGQAHTALHLQFERIYLISLLILAEKSLERRSWEIFAYKGDLVKSTVQRWRKKYVLNRVLSAREETNSFILLYPFPTGNLLCSRNGTAGKTFTGQFTAPTAGKSLLAPKLALPLGVWRLGPACGALLAGEGKCISVGSDTASK